MILGGRVHSIKWEFTGFPTVLDATLQPFKRGSRMSAWSGERYQARSKAACLVLCRSTRIFAWLMSRSFLPKRGLAVSHAPRSPGWAKQSSVCDSMSYLCEAGFRPVARPL
jgi:hypothetical protein